MKEFATFDELLIEATTSVEQELAIEDKGWILLGGTGTDTLTNTKRIEVVKQSRLYYALDPLARQAIRLWTDYTFGTGMTWQSDDDKTTEVLESFWDSKDNQSILGSRGQRKASDKLLVDGEVFFAIFLGSDKSTIRLIDPLEITEIVTDPDDIENVMFYKRAWLNRQGQAQAANYRSVRNIKNKATKDASGATIAQTNDALVYHLAYNTIGQRGYPLLTPAIDWIKQYRRFLASRVAIMLALSRFAWHGKIQGGQAAVDAAKAIYHEQIPAAGSVLIENMGSDLQPIKTDSGAGQAYQDGRMLKLQVCSAVGIPEQYFGDIATGNLATAKTVELPLMKMFQSYQAVWRDAYQDINEVILEHNGVSPDKWYVDMDFPAIAPEDVSLVAQLLQAIALSIPELMSSPDVQKIALLALGINDPAEVLDALAKESKDGYNPTALIKELRKLKISLKE